MNIQSWFPLGFTGLISLLPKGFSRVFSSTTIQKHPFCGAMTNSYFIVSIIGSFHSQIWQSFLLFFPKLFYLELILFLISFYWSIVTLQCRVSLCYITQWTSRIDTHILSLSDFFPFQVATEHWIVSCAKQQILISYLFYTQYQ